MTNKATPPTGGSKSAPRRTSTVTLIAPKRVSKADPGTNEDVSVLDVVVSGVNPYPDDTFSNSYGAAQTSNAVAIIEPLYKPGMLNTLVTRNNILSQCVDAMEVNVDGTGHEFVLSHEDTPEDKAEKAWLEDFFDEPFPGKSMITIRRDMRRDLESNGCGYLEIRRNLTDEIQMLNHLEAEYMRLVRLDQPVPVEKTVTRKGKETVVQLTMPERRFVQILNGKKMYFKEFGASRDLNKRTGQWAKKGTRLPFDLRATEILYFTVNKEPRTPYGSPRWINQIPSVLGSRMAEEYNLDFFDAGGLPPLLVIVQGGYLADGMKDELEAHLSGQGANKHRAAVIEALSSSGSLDSSGTVKVQVERFGAERQQDAMFQTYDKNAEEHVRVGFRLPPMFIGRAQDYNFATAMTGYMTAEAQVFAPERHEFDERLNKEILKALGAKSYRYKSKPITLSDIANILAGIEAAATNKIATPKSLIDEMNKILGTHMESQDPPQPPVPGALPGNSLDGAGAPPKPGDKPPVKQPAVPGKPAAKELPTATGGKVQTGKVVPIAAGKKTVAKNDDGEEYPVEELIELASKWGGLIGLGGGGAYTQSLAEEVKAQVNALKGEPLRIFNEALAAGTLVHIDGTLDSLAELCGCAAELTESSAE